jgi:hypothetical protein
VGFKRKEDGHEQNEEHVGILMRKENKQWGTGIGV